ncbi:hypothetical protein K1719_039194 [Acacia pycnantha]|nr:hypothetical protein K1719_041829 [Acacia pycnantha]KAI9078853.1 hypothetical protein K1719_039194 [Acacia pycnantha]
MLLELRIPRSKCVPSKMHLLEGKMGIKEVMVGIVAVFYGHNGAKASEMASKLLGIYTSGKRFLVGMNCILEGWRTKCISY